MHLNWFFHQVENLIINLVLLSQRTQSRCIDYTRNVILLLSHRAQSDVLLFVNYVTTWFFLNTSQRPKRQIMRWLLLEQLLLTWKGPELYGIPTWKECRLTSLAWAGSNHFVWCQFLRRTMAGLPNQNK
jgi:hypothetical protein